MNCEIITTFDFVRDLRHLSKKYHSIKDDVAKLGEEIRANPTMGINLGDGIRKVRMAITSKGKGKSTGARVITYNVITHAEEGRVILVTIYDKSECPSVTKREIVSRLKQAGIVN
ncbi:MAG: addiction module toxin RelE [Bacteroidales bacterium]|nr:addiction module toxin RelE [Bacteroidales bacterium]